MRTVVLRSSPHSGQQPSTGNSTSHMAVLASSFAAGDPNPAAGDRSQYAPLYARNGPRIAQPENPHKDSLVFTPARLLKVHVLPLLPPLLSFRLMAPAFRHRGESWVVLT